MEGGGCLYKSWGYVEGDRWAGARENRGREGYGRREERGREAGFPRWREPGEKKEYCVTFCKTKRTKGREPLQKGTGSGSKGYGRREFQTPLSPPTDMLIGNFELIAGLQLTSLQPCWWTTIKRFPPLGTELFYHANSAKNFLIVLSPNMATLSRGCKPRIMVKGFYGP